MTASNSKIVLGLKYTGEVVASAKMKGLPAMSIKAVDWALRESPVTDTGAKLVLVGLANHSTDNGTGAYPSRETLARYASCSVRTVSTKLKHLIDLGVIKPGDQQMVSHIRGDRRPVVYDINFDVQISHPVRQENDDVQNLHPVETSNEMGDGVQSTTPRGESYDTHGVKRSAHNTSLEPSLNPSMKNDDVAGGSTTSAPPFNEGQWPALSEPASTGVAAPTTPRVDPTLAPGMVLPAATGWQPSPAALATARSSVMVMDIPISIARYRVVKGEQKRPPTSSEWLKWLLADEVKAKAQKQADDIGSSRARSWHSVAD